MSMGGNNQAWTREEVQLMNQTIFEKLASDDPVEFKEAQQSINDYTRYKLREDSFMEIILPAEPIPNGEFDRQWDEENPVKVVDMEPDSPAAVSIPLGTLPISVYIRGDRYKVTFCRVTTPRFTKDVDQLRTWYMDIRQILSDNAIKDIAAEQDARFITAIDAALGTTPGQTLATSGIVQYEEFPGPSLTRDILAEMLEILPSTPSNLETQTILCNTITMKQVLKYTANEVGPDITAQVFRDGWTEEKLFGRRLVATIKKNLVPRLHFYLFADQKFLGKHYEVEPVVMHVKKEAYFIEFFAYKFHGAAFGHTNGLAHIRVS